MPLNLMSPLRSFAIYFVNWFEYSDVLHALTHAFIGIYGVPAMAVCLFLLAFMRDSKFHECASAIAEAMIDPYADGRRGMFYCQPYSWSSGAASPVCTYTYRGVWKAGKFEMKK